MSIVAQWKAFSQELLTQAGFEYDFYPFQHPMITNQVINTHSNYKHINYIGVKTIVKHKDPEFYPDYSALLILRNDGVIAKGGSKSKSEYEPQYPGTIIIVNIHAIHHVIADKRIKTPNKIPCWIAASIEYQNKPKRDEVEEEFRQFLNQKLMKV